MKDYIQTYNNWVNDIKSYESDRKRPISVVKPNIITIKEVSKNQNIYNPILQKYNDKTREENFSRQIKENFIHTLSKNKDNALRIEQLHDIFTHKNKLERLIPHNDEFERKIINRAKSSKYEKPYNIISGKNLIDHHYDMPEKREIIIKQIEKNQNNLNEKLRPNTTVFLKPLITTRNNYKDFDIITNEYHEDNLKKKQVNEKANFVNNCKKYWNNHNLNPIEQKYYDDAIESDYIKKQKIISKQNIDKKLYTNIDYKGKVDLNMKYFNSEGSYYNIITKQIVNEKKMNIDDIKKEKKQTKYKVQYLNEEYNKIKEKDRFEKEKKNEESKNSSKRYETEDLRMYDLINHEKNNSTDKLKNKVKANDKLRNWDKIVSQAKDKDVEFKVYKKDLDVTDFEKDLQKFKLNQQNEIKEFDRKHSAVFANKQSKSNKIIIESDPKIVKDNFISKEIWFNNYK